MNARYVSVSTYVGKNILIPNESMVTERVHNWSYENPQIQLKITFSVLYTTDLELVQNLVNQILSENTDILKDQKFSCVLSEFGENGIQYEIRVWVDGSKGIMLSAKHNILFAIWKTFKEYKIDMPQPYYELYANSLKNTQGE